MGLALDEGLGRFSLGVEAVERLLQTLLGGFAGVDRTPNCGSCLGARQVYSNTGFVSFSSEAVRHAGVRPIVTRTPACPPITGVGLRRRRVSRRLTPRSTAASKRSRTFGGADGRSDECSRLSVLTLELDVNNGAHLAEECLNSLNETLIPQEALFATMLF